MGNSDIVVFAERDFLADWREKGSLLAVILSGDLSVEYIHGLSPQLVAWAIRESYLEDCAPLIELLSPRQLSQVLDIDLWRKDSFNDERFMGWLSAIGSGAFELAFRQQFLRCLKEDVVAVLVRRYLSVLWYDEPRHDQPYPGFFTLDGGSTWIGISAALPEQADSLRALLTDLHGLETDFFYKLLMYSTSGTSVELEEAAYGERTARLADLGFPSYDQVLEVHSPLPAARVASFLTKVADGAPLEAVSLDQTTTVEETRRALVRLWEFLPSSGDERQEFAATLGYIIQAAFQFFDVTPEDKNELFFLVEQVRAAINLGLERAQTDTKTSLITLYSALGLVRIYQVGLYELRGIRTLAMRLRQARDEAVSPSVGALIENLSRTFPALPTSETDPAPKAISSIAEISRIRALLEAAEH